MAIVSARLFFSKGRKKLISYVIIDAFVKEGHKRSANVTKFPVEDGVTISDHVILNPLTLKIEGVIGKASLFGSLGRKNEGLDAYHDLSELMHLRIPIFVVTGLKIYENMIIEDFRINRTAANGGSLVFTMDFIKIIQVKSQTATVPNSQLGGDTQTQQQSQDQQDIGTSSSGQSQGGLFGLIEQKNIEITAGFDKVLGPIQ